MLSSIFLILRAAFYIFFKFFDQEIFFIFDIKAFVFLFFLILFMFVTKRVNTKFIKTEYVFLVCKTI